MKKTIKNIPMGETATVYTVKLESDPCLPTGPESYQTCKKLLQEIANNPGTLDCGPLHFQKMNVLHDGEKWVVLMEATG